jgi:hypothetical protein
MGGCTSKDKTVAENEGCVKFFHFLSFSLTLRVWDEERKIFLLLNVFVSVNDYYSISVLMITNVVQFYLSLWELSKPVFLSLCVFYPSTTTEKKTFRIFFSFCLLTQMLHALIVSHFFD